MRSPFFVLRGFRFHGSANFVRIRIYGIMGFSGFYRRSLSHIRFVGILGCGETRGLGETQS